MKEKTTIKIMKKGDRVLFVSGNFIAIEKASREVDLVPLEVDENGLPRVKENQIVTIGYGNNEIESDIKYGNGKIHIKTF